MQHRNKAYWGFVKGDEEEREGLVDGDVEQAGSLIENYTETKSAFMAIWGLISEWRGLPAESIVMSMLGLKVLYHL